MNLPPLLAIITVIAFIAFIVFIISTAVYIVHGFEMTKNLTEETKILDICMHLDAYIPNCWDMYGGIDTPYGEPLK